MKENTFTNGLFKSFIQLVLLLTINILVTKHIKDSNYSVVIAYLISAIVLLLFNLKYITNCLKKIKLTKKVIIDCLLYSVLFISLANFVNFLIQDLTNTLPSNNELVVALIKQNPFIIIQTVILVPIVEELIFRAPYANISKNKKVNFILYSLIFAGFHSLLSGSLIQSIYIVPYFLLSIGIGFSFYKTDNILLSIVIHIINNLLEIMLLFI